jgi:hypothetical protein
MADPRVPNIEDRITAAFERVVTTAERVGLPIATFAVGAWAIFLSDRTQIAVLPWLGVTLILASLAAYVWLTARSTIKVQSPPPPIPSELKELMEWMVNEITIQAKWARARLEEQGALLTKDAGEAQSTD